MKSLLEFCIWFVCLGLPIQLAYRWIFQPLAIKKLSYKVYRVRDGLRLMAIRGAIGQNDKAFRVIDRYCNASVHVVRSFDFADVLVTDFDATSNAQSENDLKLIKESKAELRAKFTDLMFAMVGAALVNSPGLVIVLGFVSVIVVPAIVVACLFERCRKFASRLIARFLASLNQAVPKGEPGFA